MADASAANPSPPPDAAAVVVTYRRPRLAGQAVRMLLGSEGIPPDRLILVVNGEGGLDDPGLERSIQVIRLPVNLGPAAGFRTGMQVATAEYGVEWIYLCEDDVGLFDLPTPRVARVLAELSIRPDLAEIGAVVAYGRHLNPRTGHTVAHRAASPQGYDEVQAASWGASLVSRRVVDSGILPDDDYFFGYEDFDFWYRVRAAGFRLLVDQTSSAHVAPFTSMAGRDSAFAGTRPIDVEEPWRAFYVARNYFLLARRHGSATWILAHLAYSARRLQLARTRSERAAILRGLAAGALGRRGKDHRYLRTVGELPETIGTG